MSRKPELLITAIRHPEAILSYTLGQWDDLIRLARAANLLSKLADALVLAGLLDSVPTGPRQHLISAEILSNHQRQAIQWELHHIAQALAPLDIPVVLLKGAAYVHAGLPAANGRLFGDIDVLVPRAELPRTEAALMLHGWGADEQDAYNQRYYRQWMHELPPMVNRNRGTVIDVHHNILPLTARTSPSAQDLLDQSQRISGSIFSVLAPCDMVLHSATHLFFESEFKNGLRDLFDLGALLDYFSNSDPHFWIRLVERARSLGLSQPLSYAFRYCQQMIGTKISLEVSQAVDKDSSQSKLQARILNIGFSRALRPDHTLAADQWTAAARFGLYLRGHYLRMPTPLLLRHLGRKAFMRLVKSDSRSHE